MIAINRKSYIVLPFIIAFCVTLVAVFFSGCGDDEEDEFINPQSTVVGSQGGTALSADGNATVEIPAGAVSSDTTIMVGESPNIPPNTIGKAYKFGPQDLQFSKPATIRLKYGQDDVPVGVRDADLAMGRESNGKWVEISSYMVDAPNHMVSGSVTGFSSYGIFCSHIPSTSAEYWNLVNLQVCNILDGIREMNTGLLMIFRACERDFTQEFDPTREDYSEEETFLIMAGLIHMGEAITPLRDAILDLEMLEKAAMGVGAPAHPARSNHMIGDCADSINSIVFPLVGKLWEFAGGEEFVSENVPLVAVTDKISYQMKVMMVGFIGMVIEEMDRAKDDNGMPTGIYCRRACELNKLFKRVFGELLHEPVGDDICVQDKSQIHAKAFNALNQPRSSSETLRVFTHLSRDMATCFYDWMAEFKRYVPKAAAQTAEAGGEMYWDAIKKIAIQGEVSDALDKAGYVELVSDAFNELPAPGRMAPGNTIEAAHAVVFLVPHDMDNLPILVMAVVAENGVMRIPEPYIGTYKLHFYSKGNYPIILDDVIISAGNQSIDMPEPQPLEGITTPLFTALTTGDPKAGLDPPPRPSCPVCAPGSYRLIHEARTFGEVDTPNVGVWLEYETDVEFPFDFEGSEAFVEVPYIIHKTFTFKIDEFGGMVTWAPSSFDLAGTAKWHIRKENQDGQPCYFASVSTVEEETQNFVASYRDADGNVFVLNDRATVTTWGDVDIFPSGKLGCGELPVTYELHEEVAIGPVGGEKDITVTIKED